MEPNYTVLDRAALALSGGLITLGIVVLGVVEILAGKPYGAAPLKNDAGEIIATPAVDPVLRTGLVLLGLVVLLAWGVVRMLTASVGEVDRRETDVAAD